MSARAHVLGRFQISGASGINGLVADFDSVEEAAPITSSRLRSCAQTSNQGVAAARAYFDSKLDAAGSVYA